MASRIYSKNEISEILRSCNSFEEIINTLEKLKEVIDEDPDSYDKIWIGKEAVLANMDLNNLKK